MKLVQILKFCSSLNLNWKNEKQETTIGSISWQPTATPAQLAWQPTDSACATTAVPAAQRRCTADSGGILAVAHRRGLGRCDTGHMEAARLEAHRGWSRRRQLAGRWCGFGNDMKKDGNGATSVGLVTGEWQRFGLASSDDTAGPA
jgi:hypothetical protein